MRRLTLKVISICGRYSVLLLLPPVVLAGWSWFLQIDDLTGPLIAVGVPLFIVVLATMVLVLGMLLASVRRPSGITLDRAAAPDIWAYWDIASPAGLSVRRQIIIDAEINAAMVEHSRFAGLLGRDQTLILGLGLLILLDRPAVEAVLEHEFAHAELKHSSGLTKIHEFLMTYEAFDGHVAEELPTVDVFLDLVFTSFARWLEKEYWHRSKTHELEADRQSADRVGATTGARAQILLEGSANNAETMILKPLEKELAGALVAPTPVLDRIVEKRAELTSLGNIETALKAVLLEKPDPDATHPPLEERLAAIGAKPDMAITPVGPPAFETMLPEATRERLLRDLNDQWVRAVDDAVRVE